MDPRYLGTPKSSPQVVDDLVAVAAWYFGDGGGGAEVEHAIPKGNSSWFPGVMLNFVGVLIINVGEVWSIILKIFGVHASLLKLY